MRLAVAWLALAGCQDLPDAPARPPPATVGGSPAAPSAYDAISLAGGYLAVNVAHRFSTEFGIDGIELRPSGSPRVMLRLSGLGRGADLVAPPEARPVARARRVEYARGPGLVEWYVNGPEGLEQGFTIHQRPAGAGELLLEIAMAGELGPALVGDEVELRDGTGATVLRYGKLLARDARGRRLRASLGVRGSRLVLEIDDRRAVYPVEIDPLVWREQQQLVASDAAAGDRSGTSVSIDVDTVVVGTQYGDAAATDAGSAHVFVRSGSTWTEQQILVASDAAVNARFGYATAVNGDTAVVGAFNWDEAYVFVRSGSTWMEEAILVGDGGFNDRFGHSAGVSGDTAIVGAYLDDLPLKMDAGTAYVYTRSGSTWSQQQRLEASDAEASDLFGWSVSVDGDTAVVGARQDDHAGGSDAGSAYVFVRSGSTWTEQQRLTASDAAINSLFGYSVAVDGDTAIVGGYGNGAYVFVRAGSTWTEQQKLVGGVPSDAYFGLAVSVSGDRAVVGAVHDDPAAGANAGSAFVFVRSGSTWTEEQKLVAGDGAMDDEFGSSVSLSGDTAVVGAQLDDDPVAGTDVGSAYVFRVALEEGDACTAPTQCQSYFCENGLCCAQTCAHCMDCNALGTACDVTEPPGDCLCGTCDGAGTCVYDDTQDGDCPLCQECSGAGTCAAQAAGVDVKDDCPTGMCVTGTCDGAGACGFAMGGSCGDGCCIPPEDLATCPQDCSVCPDAMCTGAETCVSCPADCNTCGDGCCIAPEDCTCADCACTPPAVCMAGACIVPDMGLGEAGVEPPADAAAEPPADMPRDVAAELGAGPEPVMEPGPEPIVDLGAEPTSEAGPEPTAEPGPEPSSMEPQSDGPTVGGDVSQDAAPGIEGRNFLACDCRVGVGRAGSPGTAALLLLWVGALGVAISRRLARSSSRRARARGLFFIRRMAACAGARGRRRARRSGDAWRVTKAEPAARVAVP